MEILASYNMVGRLALALGIGLLIGVERAAHTREQSGGIRVAGVRTYALTGLLGGVWGLLGTILGDVVLGIAFMGFAALVLFAYWTTAKKDADFGMTSEIAALLVFSLGALAVRGDMALAAGAGVVTAAMLDAKLYLHKWVARLSELELDAAIKLLIISVVVLPVLPNKGFGPEEILNPFKLWWMVVLIAGLSFIGYIAIQKVGPRVGGLLTGIFGGLASSTALTLGFAKLGKKSPSVAIALVGGIAASSTVMYLRVVVIVALFNPSLVSGLIVPIVLMALTSATGAFIAFRMASQKDTMETIEVENPCDIVSAIKFGLLLVIVLLLVHYAKTWLGDVGVYAVAALSGLADVDAISLSMAEQALGTISVPVATTAIISAVGVNTLSKVVFVGIIAGKKMAAPLSLLSALVIMAGGIGLVLMYI